MGAQAVRLSNVDIDNALKNNDFEVLFQPIFDLGNGALARMETFVRWRHASLGVLPPGAFISFFESQGRMSELTRYVLSEALTTYAAWRGPYAPGFSINLAASDLVDSAFPSHFLRLLREHDFPPELVTLECPMPAVDMDLAVAQKSFQQISETGARLAIEVRGRANEFLKTIDPFPFQEIKTGGSAILRFARTVRGPGLSAISDLLEIAKRANAAITAVGIEDQASLAALRGLGFTAAQGNHLGVVGALSDFRPARVNEVREMLGIEPLSQESLTALFRTAPPELSSNTRSNKDETESAPAPDETPSNENASAEPVDALVKRLNDRVAKQTELDNAEIATSAEPKSKSEKSVADAATAEKQKARKVAAEARKKRVRALREARKAAAIARAKAKTVAIPDTAPVNETPEVKPHAWRDRIAAEFENGGAGPQSVEKDNSLPDNSALVEASPQMESSAARKETAAVTDQSDNGETAPAAAPSAGLQGALEDATDNTPEISSEPSAGLRIAMGATRALARFIPVIRVGAPAVGGKPIEELSETAETIEEQEQVDATPAKEPPTAQPVPAPEEENARTTPEVIGDLAMQEMRAANREEATPEIAPASDVEPSAKTRRKQKPFLQRTVIKYPLRQYLPTHFWPQSWRRAFNRRAAVDTNES
ncbi:MAG: EAL domain-containing protein [Pseudomonadota bacterium]